MRADVGLEGVSGHFDASSNLPSIPMKRSSKFHLEMKDEGCLGTAPPRSCGTKPPRATGAKRSASKVARDQKSFCRTNQRTMSPPAALAAQMPTSGTIQEGSIFCHNVDAQRVSALRTMRTRRCRKTHWHMRKRRSKPVHRTAAKPHAPRACHQPARPHIAMIPAAYGGFPVETSVQNAFHPPRCRMNLNGIVRMSTSAAEPQTSSSLADHHR